MSNLTYPAKYTRLSDALERELMLAAIAEERGISLRDTFKSVLVAIRHGTVAVFNYITALSEALHEARAKDLRNPTIF